MEGSVIIGLSNGWACSNEASIIIEQRLMKNPDGSRYSQHVQTIRAMGLLIVAGTMDKDQEAEVVFKFEENGVKKAFETKVIGLTEEMAILAVTKEIFNQKDIIKKIKGGYNYGK